MGHLAPEDPTAEHGLYSSRWGCTAVISKGERFLSAGKSSLRYDGQYLPYADC